jgi:hypothetical protein
MKADDQKEENKFIPEVEAPEVVKKAVNKSPLDKSSITVMGTIREIRTNNMKIDPKTIQKPVRDFVPMEKASDLQNEALKRVMAINKGLSVPFKPRGNKTVVVIGEDGQITKFTSIIKAHKALGITKHQLTGGKTIKNEFDTVYSKETKKLIAFVSKVNAAKF